MVRKVNDAFVAEERHLAKNLEIYLEDFRRGSLVNCPKKHQETMERSTRKNGYIGKSTISVAIFEMFESYLKLITRQ